MNGASLVPEFDVEMANTRRALERVPGDKLSFKPHEKSLSLGDLAAHVANIPTWTAITLTRPEVDLAQPFDRTLPAGREEILAHFDTAVSDARSALENASAEDMKADWTLRTGDQVWFTRSRWDVFRSFVMSHLIHHRAQLTVYLRLLDIPVPGMYGPSADEQK